jgi:hypothetical protein
MAIHRSRFAALALGAAAFWGATAASAYCRTTTCNPLIDPDQCGLTVDGCQEYGERLFWPDLCVTFAVHELGSDKRAIPYTRANEVSKAAFQEWISADCGDGLTPSVGVVPRGKVTCDRLEFNHDGSDSLNVAGPNANIIVFRDDEWPYIDESRTIALTTITFATRTGEILDADIEVNSAVVDISTSDTIVTSDLQSILTHEVGHFFGLAHSLEETASMNKNYDRGDLSFRSLSQDDTNGICEIYPGTDEPIDECTGEEPRYGFSRYCGTDQLADAGCLCATPGSVGSPSSGSRHYGWLAFGLGVAAFRARRRS